MGKERRRKKQQLEGIEPMTSQGYAANLSTKNALLQLPKSYFRFSAKNSSRVLESLQRANFFSDHPLIGSDLKSLIAFFFLPSGNNLEQGQFRWKTTKSVTTQGHKMSLKTRFVTPRCSFNYISFQRLSPIVRIRAFF